MWNTPVLLDSRCWLAWRVDLDDDHVLQYRIRWHYFRAYMGSNICRLAEWKVQRNSSFIQCFVRNSGPLGFMIGFVYWTSIRLRYEVNVKTIFGPWNLSTATWF